MKTFDKILIFFNFMVDVVLLNESVLWRKILKFTYICAFLELCKEISL